MELAILVGLIVGIIVFWNKFIKMKCKKCKSTNYRQVGRQLLSSKISRSNGETNGATSHGEYAKRTRYVDETKIDVYQITYECNDCKNIWTKKKKEKTNLGRTITGSTLY